VESRQRFVNDAIRIGTPWAYAIAGIFSIYAAAIIIALLDVIP
jgi:hypothetical protein